MATNSSSPRGHIVTGGSHGHTPDLRRQAEIENQLAEKTTRVNDRTRAEAAYKDARLKAINSGVPAAQIPEPHAGMDLKAAHERLSLLTGGRGSGNVDAGQGAAGKVGGSSAGPMDHATAPASNSRSWMGKEGVSNAPAPNNMNGEANGNSLARTVTVRQRDIGMRDPSGKGKAASFADDLDFARHPTAARAEAVPPGQSQAKQGLNSKSTQGLMDWAAHIDPNAPHGDQSQTGQYGTASVRFAKPVTAGYGPNYTTHSEGLAPSQPIYAGNTGQAADVGPNQEVGVGRMSPAEMRADLFQRHPNIFKDGTPENKAYVDAVRTHPEGEAGVYGGVNDLMAKAGTMGPPAPTGVASGPMGPPAPAGVAGAPAPGAPGAIAPGSPIAKGVAAAQATGNVINRPVGAPLDVAQSIINPLVRGAATGLGVTPQGMNSIVDPALRAGGAAAQGAAAGTDAVLHAPLDLVSSAFSNAKKAVGAIMPGGAPKPAGAPPTQTAVGPIDSGVPKPTASVTPAPRGPTPASVPTNAGTNAPKATAPTLPPEMKTPGLPEMQTDANGNVVRKPVWNNVSESTFATPPTPGGAPVARNTDGGTRGPVGDAGATGAAGETEEQRRKRLAAQSTSPASSNPMSLAATPAPAAPQGDFGGNLSPQQWVDFVNQQRFDPQASAMSQGQLDAKLARPLPDAPAPAAVPIPKQPKLASN